MKVHETQISKIKITPQKNNLVKCRYSTFLMGLKILPIIIHFLPCRIPCKIFIHCHLLEQ